MRDRTTDIEMLLDGLAFTEAPRWHDGRLFFSDMHHHRVMSYDPAAEGRAETVVALDAACSGLGWMPDGSMLVVSMDDRRLLRVDDGAVSVHADLSDLTEYGINDMAVATDGTAYVGQFGYDFHHGGTPAPALLLVIEPDGTGRHGPADMMVANGMVVIDDGETLVVAESGARRLTAFTLVDGDPRDRRPYVELGERDHPDGMCIDAAGAAWVACPVSRRFIRITPAGEITDIVETGERRAIACMLDDDEQALYLCTAATLGTAEESRHTRSARIERVSLG
jgi:sugar lactone lactonase YvrE